MEQRKKRNEEPTYKQRIQKKKNKRKKEAFSASSHVFCSFLYYILILFMFLFNYCFFNFVCFFFAGQPTHHVFFTSLLCCASIHAKIYTLTFHLNTFGFVLALLQFDVSLFHVYFSFCFYCFLRVCVCFSTVFFFLLFRCDSLRTKIKLKGKKYSSHLHLFIFIWLWLSCTIFPHLQFICTVRVSVPDYQIHFLCFSGIYRVSSSLISRL